MMVAANDDGRTYSVLLRGRILARRLTREEGLDLVLAYHELEQEIERLEALLPQPPEILEEVDRA